MYGRQYGSAPMPISIGALFVSAEGDYFLSSVNSLQSGANLFMSVRTKKS